MSINQYPNHRAHCNEKSTDIAPATSLEASVELGTVVPAIISEDHAAHATSVKPAEEVAVPTEQSDIDDLESTPTTSDDEDIGASEEGQDFFSYILALSIFVVIGIFLWWAGVGKHLTKLRGRSQKAKYNRVADEDVEKQRD